MKLLFASLPIPVLLGAALAVQPRAQEAELPFLTYWEAQVPRPLWSEWKEARRAVEFHIEDHHAGIFRSTGYEELLDDSGRAFQFGELRGDADLTDALAAYQADQDWRVLDADERDLLVDRLERTVYLVPLAGRSPQGRMNVRYVQRMRARVGGTGRARVLARNLVDHINEHYDGMLARAYSQETGEAGWIWLLTDFSSLGAWQDLRTRLAGDAEYARLFDQAADAFVDGSSNSMLLTGI